MSDPNDRNSEVAHNTEDKAWWLQHGLELEYEFVELCIRKLNIKAEINPAKSTTVKSGKTKEHSYIFRKDDTRGNAKSSFLLDIRTFEKIALLPS